MLLMLVNLIELVLVKSAKEFWTRLIVSHEGISITSLHMFVD